MKSHVHFDETNGRQSTIMESESLSKKKQLKRKLLSLKKQTKTAKTNKQNKLMMRKCLKDKIASLFRSILPQSIYVSNSTRLDFPLGLKIHKIIF